MNGLAVEDVYAGYTGTDILRGVGIEVRPSECLAVLGPNGAGKSTLLRVASGQLRIRAGRRIIDGEDATRWRGHRVAKAGVRWIGEPKPIFPSLSVAENLAIGGIIRRRSFDRQVKYVFEILPALYSKRNARAAELSGGQQQMLAIGQALMSEPRYLCLDEPSLGLAPAAVDSIAHLVRELVTAGLGIVWAEQFPDVALSCSSKVAVMRAGLLVRVGSPADVSREELEEAYLGNS